MTPVYGIPLSHKYGEPWLSSELTYLFTTESPGAIALYSGGGESPRAFGITAGDEIDECTHHTEMYEFTLEPTPEIVEQFNQLFAALDPELQEEIKQFGEPRLFYLWSSS